MRKILRLDRYGSTPRGTFGELRVSGYSNTFYTVEKPWQDNEPFMSCVPEGEYDLRWLPTTTQVPPSWGGHSWYLSGATVGVHTGHRTRCCLHIANVADNVEGCVGVGQRLGVVSGQWAVLSSADALTQLLGLVGPEDARLVINRTPH